MPDNDLGAEKRERVEDTKWYREALIRLKSVGQVLRVTMLLCALSNAIGALFLPQLTRDLKLEDLPPVIDQKDFESIRQSAPLFEFVVACGLSLIYLPAMLTCKKIETGATPGNIQFSLILSMLPCGVGFLLGIPIGIWALVVLGHPNVKAVLVHRARQAKRYERRDSHPGRKEQDC